MSMPPIWMTFDSLMSNPLVLMVAEKNFGKDPDWMCRFICATRVCLTQEPEVGFGKVCPFDSSAGAAIFYAPGAMTGAMDPWTFTVDLGASAWFTFKRIPEPSPDETEDQWPRFSCGDDEPFSPELLAFLSTTMWRPINWHLLLD